MLDKATGGLEDQDTGVKKKRKVSDNIKAISYYRRTANAAWKDFELDLDEEVEFRDFLKLLDHQDMFLVDQQAKRAFYAVDVDGSGEMGMSEYENFLMAYDLLGGGTASQELVFIDVYDSFKMNPSAEYKEFSSHDGMDFSAFVEACHLFGAKADEEDMMRAVMEVCKLKVIEKVAETYMTHDQFKRAWLIVADVETELENRGLKPERGRFGKSRNRDRLFRFITDQETAYMMNIKKINDTVESVKREDRLKKDEKKRDAKGKKDALEQEANKFKAIRGMEKRLLVKREQEERSKKRAEEKLLKNKVAAQKAINDQKALDAIKQHGAVAEKLRLDEIKQKGLDRVDLENEKLRLVPTTLYIGEQAQERLSYAEILNFSYNMLDHLPEENFFYWLSGLRKLKLSYNRIRKLPAEVNKCELIEVLEMEQNKLVELPRDIGNFTRLARLELSSNALTELPDSLGLCGNLRYVSAHSNYLWHMPSSLGACFGLEYLDLSKNKISELPEDYSHLQSLTYLDVSSNKIGHLPHHIGDCAKLKSLNVSHNQLSSIPLSFQSLEMLEYCNLQCNNIILTQHNFKNNKKLKCLLMDRNHIKRIYHDVQCLVSLTQLDLNSNQITDLPPEIGLMHGLESLRISYNELEHVPLELGSLQCLLNLDMSHNRIEGPMPGPLGLLTSLRHLDLSFNHFDSLPESMVGFSELVTFTAERNLITALPQTITYLDTLEHIDVSNNRFTVFPIHLQHMKNLKTLNMRNNNITLLPREMHTMTGLELLDLSKNRLMAVPTEFADVFETVPEVCLEDNPWDMLPERWGKLWPGKAQTDGLKGYGVGEAVDFLYGMRAIYACAEQIWVETGVYHYTNRMTLREFLHELRTRLPHTWYEGLQDKAQHLYFSAKQTGSFPRWYTADKKTQLEEADKKVIDAAQRDRNVARAKVEMDKRVARIEKAYGPDVRRRAVRKEEQLAEHAVNEEVAQNMGMVALHHSVRQREARNVVRREERKAMLAKRDKDEIKRLQEVVRVDLESGIQ